jgi:hypothetical protein
MKESEIAILDVSLNVQVFASVSFLMTMITGKTAHIEPWPSVRFPARNVTLSRRKSFVARHCEPTLLQATKMRADGGRIPEESPRGCDRQSLKFCLLAVKYLVDHVTHPISLGPWLLVPSCACHTHLPRETQQARGACERKFSTAY